MCSIRQMSSPAVSNAEDPGDLENLGFPNAYQVTTNSYFGIRTFGNIFYKATVASGCLLENF